MYYCQISSVFIYSAILLFIRDAVSSKIVVFALAVAWVSDAVSVFLLACCLAVLMTRRARRWEACLPFPPMLVWLGPAFRALPLLDVSAVWHCSLAAFTTPLVPVSDFVSVKWFRYTFCRVPAYCLMLYLLFCSSRIWMYSQVQVIQSLHVLTVIALA